MTKINSLITKAELKERLIQFAATIIELAEELPSNFAGTHLGHQSIRSGTSPSLNYGEAQGAESRIDFIHKMKVGLKELRETYCCLRIIQKKKWVIEERLSIVQMKITNLFPYLSKASSPLNRILIKRCSNRPPPFLNHYSLLYYSLF